MNKTKQSTQVAWTVFFFFFQPFSKDFLKVAVKTLCKVNENSMNIVSIVTGTNFRTDQETITHESNEGRIAKLLLE